ncbi:hypothetical protein B0H13DRAFT_1884209 [Mycena leptocephala]|nr:hypothetical protein B0H13DRAFT_1884209 [Mycena leptocephala]
MALKINSRWSSSTCCLTPTRKNEEQQPNTISPIWRVKGLDPHHKHPRGNLACRFSQLKAQLGMAKMHLNWIELEVARVRTRPCTITAPRFLPPSPRRDFFKLNAGNWRRVEAPCMRGSDELEDSRELEDSEGACWLEVDRWMGRVGKGIDLKECDLGTVADVQEDNLVIDVGENKVRPTTGRDAGSGTCKDDVDDRNINEGGVDDERADLWGREFGQAARRSGTQDFEDVGDGYGLVCRP